LSTAGTNLLAATAAICAAAFCAFTHCAPQARYVLVPGDNGVAYQLDSTSGRAWMLTAAGARLLEDEDDDEGLSELLPPEEATKVTGNANIEDARFDGTLYNGSDTWVITKVVVEIYAEDPETHKTLWSRRFAEKVRLEPLTVGSLEVRLHTSGLREARRAFSSKGKSAPVTTVEVNQTDRTEDDDQGQRAMKDTLDRQRQRDIGDALDRVYMPLEWRLHEVRGVLSPNSLLR